MSGDAYWYVVPFAEGPEAALRRLVEREFRAGRYYPASASLDFPVTASSPAPGAKHPTIAAARRAAGPEGTRSILDVDRIGELDAPRVAARIPDSLLHAVLGTLRPARDTVLEKLFFLTEDMERGRCRYVVLFADDSPSEILFVGVSYD